MGWGRIGRVFKPVVSTVRGAGRTIKDNPEKLLVAAALGPVAGGAFLAMEGLGSEMDREKKKANEATANAQAKAAADTAEANRLKTLADESVRQQEEVARRRTIFGGGSIDEQNQRKTLLGL